MSAAQQIGASILTCQRGQTLLSLLPANRRPEAAIDGSGKPKHVARSNVSTSACTCTPYQLRHTRAPSRHHPLRQQTKRGGCDQQGRRERKKLFRFRFCSFRLFYFFYILFLLESGAFHRPLTLVGWGIHQYGTLAPTHRRQNRVIGRRSCIADDRIPRGCGSNHTEVPGEKSSL